MNFTRLKRSDLVKGSKASPLKTGFTVIELMVVVSVMAILSSIAIPKIVELRSNARVTTVKAALDNIYKVCQVKIMDNISGNEDFNPPSVDGYRYIDIASPGDNDHCDLDDIPSYESLTGEMPVFAINVREGTKWCTPEGDWVNDPKKSIGCACSQAQIAQSSQQSQTAQGEGSGVMRPMGVPQPELEATTQSVPQPELPIDPGNNLTVSSGIQCAWK